MRSVLIMALLAAASSGAAQAQQTIVVPLEGRATLLSDGSIAADCTSIDGVSCNTFAAGPGQGAAVSLLSQPSSGVIAGSHNVTLSWSAPWAKVCRPVQAGPAPVGEWAAALLPAGAKTVSVVSPGSYQFGVRCFDDIGMRGEATTGLDVAPNGDDAGGDNYCAEVYPDPPSEGAFYAYGFEKVEVPWETVFGAPAGDTAGRQGIPGAHLSDYENTYLAIPFVMTNDTDHLLRRMLIEWVEGSPIVGLAGSGSVSVTISPCAGDFRTRSGHLTGSDPYLAASCGDSSMYGRVVAGTPGYGCPSPVGKRMYLNVITRGMGSSGYGPNSCSNVNGPCGVNMRVND